MMNGASSQVAELLASLNLDPNDPDFKDLLGGPVPDIGAVNDAGGTAPSPVAGRAVKPMPGKLPTMPLDSRGKADGAVVGPAHIEPPMTPDERMANREEVPQNAYNNGSLAWSSPQAKSDWERAGKGLPSDAVDPPYPGPKPPLSVGPFIDQRKARANARAKELIAKARPKDIPAPTLGSKDFGPEAPQEALAAAPGGPRGAVAAAVMGASPMSPPPVPPPAQDTSLHDAQNAAKSADSRASLLDQLNGATDAIAGTRFAQNHYGDAMRKNGRQGVQDVLDRAKQNRENEDQGFKREDQGFQRTDEGRKVATDQRLAEADDRTKKAFADSQEMNTPGTRQAKAYESLFRAKRPRESAGISKEQAATFSANDWKEALNAKDDPIAKPVGAGGGSASGKTMSALSKLIPPETANLYNGSQRIHSLVKNGGGWDQIRGIGFVQGKIPGMFLGENEKALRQEIGNYAGIYLQSKGGKAITHTEEGLILGRIAANPNDATAEQLKRAMDIIDRNAAGNVRQGLAPASDEQRRQLLENAGIPEDWVNQPGAAPTGSDTAPTGDRNSQAEAWALANPNDPRSAKILQKLNR